MLPFPVGVYLQELKLKRLKVVAKTFYDKAEFLRLGTQGLLLNKPHEKIVGMLRSPKAALLDVDQRVTFLFLQARTKETLLYNKLKESGEIQLHLDEAQKTELFLLESDKEVDEQQLLLHRVQLLSGSQVLPRLALLGQRNFENTILAMEVALMGPMSNRLSHNCQKMIAAMMLRCGILLAIEPRSVIAVYRTLC
jgi:hypothetical protein